MIFQNIVWIKFIINIVTVISVIIFVAVCLHLSYTLVKTLLRLNIALDNVLTGDLQDLKRKIFVKEKQEENK